MKDAGYWFVVLQFHLVIYSFSDMEVSKIQSPGPLIVGFYFTSSVSVSGSNGHQWTGDRRLKYIGKL